MQTSAYRLRISTDSADSNALILLANGELVAILVELADESHGDERDKWSIEATFGLHRRLRAPSFATAGDAADWVSNHICHHPFSLIGPIAELG